MVVDAEEQSGHGGYWAAVGPLVEAFVTRHEADDEAVFRYEARVVGSASPLERVSLTSCEGRGLEYHRHQEYHRHHRGVKSVVQVIGDE